jgi:sugar phosphate isomerase/epimerase
MLLTLATRSLAPQINGDSRGGFSLLDVPGYVSRELMLRGINLSAAMLSGWSLEQLDQLRDQADKAACPCLVLIEDAPLPLSAADEHTVDAAVERVSRLAVAAHRLGCSSLAVSCDAPDTDEAMERTALSVRDLMPRIERLELNLLLSPSAGLTHDPDRLTDLIKTIGGFRIGSLPTFGHAAETGDAIETLRKLAPYAGAVHATINAFDKKGAHKGYDLAACVTAIRSVGFQNTLAIDYIGPDEPAKPIEQARKALEEAVALEV